MSNQLISEHTQICNLSILQDLAVHHVLLFSISYGKKMVMVSATINAHARARSGPRPLDIRRDLKQVANLIEQAFGPELDAAGWAALHELQMMARMGRLLSWLGADSTNENYMGGFVWVDNGKIVGNVTTQPLQQHPSRYVIANVAVDKNYRGQGIARELMHIVLAHIADQGAKWAMLQVREDNDIARGMYQRLGFSEVMLEYRLHAPHLPIIPAPSLPERAILRPLGNDDWQSIRKLIKHAIPSEARWWHATRSANFRNSSSSLLQRKIGKWFGIGHKMRWGLFIEQGLVGVVDADVLLYNEHRIDILLMPELRAKWTRPLLAMALNYVQRQAARPVSAILYDYQPEAIAALREFGFESHIILANMRKRIHTNYPDQ